MNVGPMKPPESTPATAETSSDDQMEELAERVASLEVANTEDLGAKQITDDTVARAWKTYQDAVRRECERAKSRNKQPPWYLLDYVPANVRVLAFRRDYPEGKVVVDLEPFGNGQQFLATAYVFRSLDEYETETHTAEKVTEAFDKEDGLLTQRRTERTPEIRYGPKWIARARKVHHQIENAETGAASRALGFLGYGAVAGIATGEDVQEARDTKREREAEHARHVRELNERMAAKRRQAQPAKPESPDGTPKEQATRKNDDADDLRKRLIEWIGAKRIFTREAVERAFGSIDSMDAEQIKDVGRKLRNVKTRAQWAKLSATMEYRNRWSDYEGGSDLEQLRAYLWHLTRASNATDRPMVQEALDEATKLVPFDDVPTEGAKIVGALADQVDLEALEAAAHNAKIADEQGEGDDA